MNRRDFGQQDDWKALSAGSELDVLGSGTEWRERINLRPRDRGQSDVIIAVTYFDWAGLGSGQQVDSLNG
jgi:hypothetical protein